jgi:hypothetical protein
VDDGGTGLYLYSFVPPTLTEWRQAREPARQLVYNWAAATVPATANAPQGSTEWQMTLDWKLFAGVTIAAGAFIVLTQDGLPPPAGAPSR